MRRGFRQVDVFSTVGYRGNPVAVVLDGGGLSTEVMQRFAHWMNLSETTFVLPPVAIGADYRVRIFTPDQELPFAGHPTLGTAHAWLEANSGSARDEVVQECEAGLVSVRSTPNGLAFAAPPLIRSGPLDEELIAQIVPALNIDRRDVVDAAWVDNGPGWMAVLLDSAETVLALRPGMLGDLNVGVAGAYPARSTEAFEVRAFFTVNGATVEDPVTGSLNASLAQWLGGALPPYW